MIYTLDRETMVPVPLPEAFAFFEDPHNLARITPPWLHFEIATTDEIAMRAGAEIEYSIRWFGLRLGWKTTVEEYDPPRAFVDVQARGPYRLRRHSHTVEPAGNGTRVRDHVEYALPLGALGRLAHSLAVRRQLNEIFDYRQEALRRIFRVTRAT